MAGMDVFGDQGTGTLPQLDQLKQRGFRTGMGQFYIPKRPHFGGESLFIGGIQAAIAAPLQAGNLASKVASAGVRSMGAGPSGPGPGMARRRMGVIDLDPENESESGFQEAGNYFASNLSELNSAGEMPRGGDPSTMLPNFNTRDGTNGRPGTLYIRPPSGHTMSSYTVPGAGRTLSDLIHSGRLGSMFTRAGYSERRDPNSFRAGQGGSPMQFFQPSEQAGLDSMAEMLTQGYTNIPRGWMPEYAQGANPSLRMDWQGGV